MNCPSNYTSSLSTFPSNSDITGVGNRAALYISSFLGWILALWAPDDIAAYRDAARTALLTSTSLIIAGLYALYSGNLGLTLVDAQIITMLVFLVTVCYYEAVTSKEANFGRTTRWAALLHGVLSAAFGILVYAQPDTFGGIAYIPECPNSEYIFVVFGSISATNTGLRIFALLVFSLQIFIIIYKNRRDWSLMVLTTVRGENPLNVRRPGKKTKVAVTATALIAMTYFVVTIEKMIQRNGLTNQSISTIDQWTFGQTLAIIMLLDQALKVCSRIRHRMYLNRVLRRKAAAKTAQLAVQPSREGN